jgi:hypothetical protein
LDVINPLTQVYRDVLLSQKEYAKIHISGIRCVDFQMHSHECDKSSLSPYDAKFHIAADMSRTPHGWLDMVAANES